MVIWKFSFPINGLHNVIKQEDSAINIDRVIFQYRHDNERVGTVTVEASTEQMAEGESRYLINKSLGKICFAFNTEASISLEGHYYVDLIDNPNLERVVKSIEMRYSHVKGEPNNVLAKMAYLKTQGEFFILSY